MNLFKEQCIKLRKQDYTLPEIMRMTGRSKTSVYFHIRDIALSKEKKKEIAHNSGVRGIRAAQARKGKSLRPYKPFKKWSRSNTLLTAHLIFDGEIMNRKCVYNNHNDALIKRVISLMNAIYDYPPRIHMNRVSGVHKVQYNNVALASFLFAKANELKKIISSRSKNEQREFIRAFFDDEGCMDLRYAKNIRQIRGYQNDTEILKLIQQLLTRFDIQAQLRGGNEVVIVGKENLKKFQKEINFSAGVYINGNRSNSIWKQSIEKRELLDQAIKSFKK